MRTYHNAIKHEPIVHKGVRFFPMDQYRAMMIIDKESGLKTDSEEVKAAWNYLIQSGAVAELGGSYKEAAEQLIKGGKLLAPVHQAN